MRVRHRIPSIFNLSMVDVLCCALGCVILLWLLNLRLAKEHEDTAAKESREASALLAKTKNDRDIAYARIHALESRLAALVNEKESLQKTLDAQLASARVLEGKLRAAGEEIAALGTGLKASKKETEDETRRAEGLARRLAETLASLKKVQLTADLIPGLRADILAAEGRYKTAQATAALVPGLRKNLGAVRKRAEEEEALARALTKQVREGLDKLKEMEESMTGLRKTKAALETDLTQARTYKERWEKVRDQARDYKDKLETADGRAEALGRRVAMLEGDKRRLQGQVGRLQAVVDNRFAGIELTGRNVVFLVDMSGSMTLVGMDRDGKEIRSPNKWPGVCRTVVKLMQSLPKLEKYQVILFSNGVEFPMGGEGGWLAYKGKASEAAVLEKLSAITPKGDTNMYAALRATFLLRAQGLDTVYLLSDGLPNMGEGVAPAAATRMRSEKKDVELGRLLGEHIRNTLNLSWNRPRPGRSRVRINAIGFFYESPDVGAFLWALSRENDGSFVGMSKP